MEPVTVTVKTNLLGRSPPPSSVSPPLPSPPNPTISSSTDLGGGGMDFFADGLVVRLRSRIRGGGLYLYARDDGHGVALSPRRSSPNTGWEVRRFQREGTDCFVLRSPSTGHCLAPAADQRKRRTSAIQRDYVEGQRATVWRATWAGHQHGDVIIRDFFFGRKLCAEEEPRQGNRVFVQVQRAAGRGNGMNKRTATASSAFHWFVEAALPFTVLPAAPKPPATGHPARYSCIRVPRLNLDTVASARLPILGAGNQFVGYLPASSVIGLRELVDRSGGGQILQADAASVGGDASNDQLVTALAFMAGTGTGRGRRNGGIKSLPLRLRLHDAPAVLDTDDHDVVEEEAVGADEPEALEEQVQVVAQAAEGLQANDDVGDAEVEQPHQQQIVLSSLADAYDVMESVHRSVSHLTEKKRAIAEQAAAQRNWSGVGKVQRGLDKSITMAIAAYDKADQKAAGLRESLLRLGVLQPPSPPPLLRMHPAHLLPGRRG